jgi:hypothetical protein
MAGVLEHLRQEEHDLEAMEEVEEHHQLEALAAEAEVGERLRTLEEGEEGVVGDCQPPEEAEQDELTAEEGAVEEERSSLEFWEAMVVA